MYLCRYVDKKVTVTAKVFIFFFHFSDKYTDPYDNPFLYAWFACQLVSSLYTYTWDVKMDWGLFSCGPNAENKFLREEIVYSPGVSFKTALIQTEGQIHIYTEGGCNCNFFFRNYVITQTLLQNEAVLGELRRPGPCRPRRKSRADYSDLQIFFFFYR